MICTAVGTNHETFEITGYTTQVVAGLNYQLKIHVGDNQYIHAKVYKPLPHTGNPPSVSAHSTNCTADGGFNF